MSKKSLYNKILQNVILPIGEFVIGSSMKKNIKKWDAETKLSKEKIKQLQQDKLNKLLKHAIANCDYYKNIELDDNLSPYENIRKFPILTKDYIRENMDSLIADKSTKLYPQYSSGSTGKKKTKVYWSHDEISSYRAVGLLWWQWAGYEMGDYLVQTGITIKRGTLKRLKDIFFRTYYIPAFTHSPEYVDKALKWMKKKKNAVLGGYASSIYVIACRAEELNMNIKLKTCMVWGDKLLPNYREKISKVFKTKVYENYGSAEGFLMAAQRDLDYMYIMDNYAYIEILDDDNNPVEDGEMGNVIVTKLEHFAMPMIRYKIGDLAIKLPKDKYPENADLKLSILQRVVGRDTDIIYTNGGARLTPYSFFYIANEIEVIEQTQFIQDDINSVLIKYISKEELTQEQIDYIKSSVVELSCSPTFVVELQRVDYIEPSPSGKPKTIISNIKRK